MRVFLVFWFLLLFIQAMLRVFLSVFARLRKATVSCDMSGWLAVCLSILRSVRVEQFGSHLTDFHEILYLKIFRKSVEKIYYIQLNRSRV